jgi:predicted Zn-dependent protease with MMP-like domain
VIQMSSSDRASADNQNQTSYAFQLYGQLRQRFTAQLTSLIMNITNGNSQQVLNDVRELKTDNLNLLCEPQASKEAGSFP